MAHGNALIIGAGVAGPVTAMALQRVGIAATIYEAYPTTAHGVGAFMGLAPNGLDALAAIELRAPVIAAGIPTPRMAMYNGAGKRLAEMANGLTLPDGTNNLTIRRADLYRVLHEEASRRGIRTEYGKSLIDVENTATGVLARFADGSTAAGGLVIGADGMRSKVRSLVAPSAPKPEFVGLIGSGGYAYGVDIDAKPGMFHFVFGKRAFLGYIAAKKGEVWWFANEPSAREPTRAELAAITPEESKRRLLKLFAEDAVPATQLISQSTHDIGWLALHAMAAPANWHRERMVLVGDAGHVTSPSSGQGASLAIEDAIVLARCLRDLPEHRDAFATYQSLRQARVRKVYENAKRMNASKAAGPIGRVLRDLLLPVFAKKIAAPEATAWLHGYHIDFAKPVGGEQAQAAA